jgi:hypothetical protein
VLRPWAALGELTESVTAVLGLSGSGVTMAEEGRLRFVTAVSQASGELERNQEEEQAGHAGMPTTPARWFW